MEYTVQKLSKLAGVSTRTLRYYDEIGILKPSRMNTSGYRIYTQLEVDILQQILFYRELDVSLEGIKEMMSSPSFDQQKALTQHYNQLLEKRKQLDKLITNVEKSIAMKKGEVNMTDKEKFEGFKQNKIQENEEKYGKELRKQYGEETVKTSYKKFADMTEDEHREWEALGARILITLKEAMVEGNPESVEAKALAALHHKWLEYTWPTYSKEAHRSLAAMYLEDERFTQYYDKVEVGAARFLKEAIFSYTAIKE
ncbi:MAG: MerR family transcriptional regulator [Cellulosilyticaceae bacterium]